MIRGSQRRPRTLVAPGAGALSRLGIVAGAVVAVALAAACEDASVGRGRDFLSIDEYTMAAKELRIALRNDPDSLVTKSLLLFALIKLEGKIGDIFLYRSILDLPFGRPDTTIGAEVLEELQGRVVKLRKKFFDLGLDTRDAAELAALIDGAAEFAFAEREDIEDRLYAAFVLGWSGNREAAEFLCRQLKGSKEKKVRELLSLLGPKGAAALRQVASDPNNWANAIATDTLREVLVAEAARTVFEAMPRLRKLEMTDLPEVLRTTKNKRYLERGFSRKVTPLFAEYGVEYAARDERRQLHASIVDSEPTSILVLTGFDMRREAPVSRVFAFRNARYEPVKVVQGKSLATEIAGETPVLAVGTVSGGGALEFFRPAVAKVEVEEPDRSVKVKQGSRIQMKGGTCKAGKPCQGVVKKLDDAMAEILLDDPNEDGDTMISLPAKFLPKYVISLVKKELEAPGYEVLGGIVKDDMLVIRPDMGRVADQL